VEPGDLIPTPLLLTKPREEPPLFTNTGPEQPRYQTKRGAAIGCPPYMAPEQSANGAGGDRAADIYSLGVVIYQALTGRQPYNASNTAEYKRLHRDAPIPSVEFTSESPWFGVTAEIDRVLGTALHKNPECRQRTAIDLASDLRAVLRASDREQLRAAAQ